MDTITLEAVARTGKPKQVRKTGMIPGVTYGRGKKSATVSVNYQAFRKVFAKAGENTIIELMVDGKKDEVLVHDMQYDPVTDLISHVDFLSVDMMKEVTTTVKVTFVGVAPAVKAMGGVLDIQKHEIKIRCLPKDLIHEIIVDISPLVDFRTSIHVKDITVPVTVKVLDKLEDTVVTVAPPRAEEVAAAATPAEGAAPVEGAVAVPAEGAAAAPVAEAKK